MRFEEGTNIKREEAKVGDFGFLCVENRPVFALVKVNLFGWGKSIRTIPLPGVLPRTRYVF